MDWRTLYDLYNGLIGKCLLYVAVTTPIAFIVRTFEVSSPIMFTVSLVGALLILVGFFICLLIVPETIKRHISPESYTTSLINIDEYIDLNSEFNQLDKTINNEPQDFKQALIDSSLTSLTFDSTQKFKDTFGTKKAIRLLSIIRYAIDNKSSSKSRMALSIVFALGSFVVFIPTIYNIYTILTGL